MMVNRKNRRERRSKDEQLYAGEVAVFDICHELAESWRLTFFFELFKNYIYIYISSLIKRNLGRRCSSLSYLRYEMRAHHVTSGNSWLLSLCALTG